jgi:ankyrin repeat protein
MRPLLANVIVIWVLCASHSSRVLQDCADQQKSDTVPKMPRAISTHSNPTTDELQSSEDGGPVVDVRDFHFQLPSRPQSLRPDEESQHVETYRICNLEELQSATTDDSDGASSEVDFTPEGSTDEDDETSLASREDQAVGRSLPSSPREIADYYEAITRGNIEAVKVHLSKGACVNRKTHNGYTPLVIAIVECQLEMAQFMLENHASVHQRVNKLAPIVYATKKSSLTKQFIQLLLDYGALPSTPFGPYYYNALHSATSNGNIDAVDLLICRGMDVESQCDEGRTAFHIATECGETMIVKLLLAKGANINHRNHNGNTALVMAVENGHTETVNLLVKEGLGVNDSNNKEQSEC